MTLLRRPPNVRTPRGVRERIGDRRPRGVTGKPGPEPTRTAPDRQDACRGERTTPGAAPGRPGARPQEGALDRPRGPLPTRVQDLPELPDAYARRPRRPASRPWASTSTPDARGGDRRHVRLLLAWTAAINLTAIRDPAEVALPPRRSTAWPPSPLLRSRGITCAARPRLRRRLPRPPARGGPAARTGRCSWTRSARRSGFLRTVIEATGLARTGRRGGRPGGGARPRPARPRGVAGGDVARRRLPGRAGRAGAAARRAGRHPRRLEAPAAATRSSRPPARRCDALRAGPASRSSTRPCPGLEAHRLDRRRAGRADRRPLPAGPRRAPPAPVVSRAPSVPAGAAALRSLGARRRPVGHPCQRRGPGRGAGGDPVGRRGLAAGRRRRLRPRAGRGGRPGCARSAPTASAATTTRPPSAGWTSRRSTSTRARRWSGRRPRSPTRPAHVARRAARAPRARGLPARPRQPARPDLGVRHHRRRSPGPGSPPCRRTGGLHGHTHVPIAYVEDDGRLETMSPGAGSRVDARRAARAAQPGQRRPAARRDPGRVVDAARHRHRASRPGSGPPTTSRRSRRRWRPAGCPSGSSPGCRMGSRARRP